MADASDDALAVAIRHVAEARRIVARQEERVARLAAAGCSTLDAEQTLDVFASTLRILKDHERMLRAERLVGKRPPRQNEIPSLHGEEFHGV